MTFQFQRTCHRSRSCSLFVRHCFGVCRRGSCSNDRLCRTCRRDSCCSHLRLRQKFYRRGRCCRYSIRSRRSTCRRGSWSKRSTIRTCRDCTQRCGNQRRRENPRNRYGHNICTPNCRCNSRTSVMGRHSRRGYCSASGSWRRRSRRGPQRP